MAERVRITDVTPRDGLQNEPGIIETAHKAALVRMVSETGVDEVEVTSFVSPRWVPQLGDAAELVGMLGSSKPPGVVWSALVPNERGMQAALSVNAGRPGGRVIDKVAVFTAASETFSVRNINATIAESIERFRPVIAMAVAARLPVRGYVSCAIACPFEGPIAPERVREVVGRLIEIGVDEIDLGDTIGAGTPESVVAMLHEVRRAHGTGRIERSAWTLHLHDTFGRAAECVKAALDVGIRSFDGSAAGLGGCPFASTPGRRAPGNISTELLVRTVHGAGFTTGVDQEKLAWAADYAARLVTTSRSGAGA